MNHNKNEERPYIARLEDYVLMLYSALHRKGYCRYSIFDVGGQLHIVDGHALFEEIKSALRGEGIGKGEFPMGVAGIVTSRHESEIKALVAALKNDPEALAKNIFIVAVFTAGRVMGAAQALDVQSEEAK